VRRNVARSSCVFQELVFIGVHMDGAEVAAALDDALLTDAEGSATDPEKWGTFEDPFRLWERGAPSARAKTLVDLAAEVVTRVESLEALQRPITDLMATMRAERQAIEARYLALQVENWRQRAIILNAPATAGSMKSPIPRFWLQAFLNHPGLEEIINQRDADALEALVDVTWAFLPNFEVRSVVWVESV
jgi:hypothetical protein